MSGRSESTPLPLCWQLSAMGGTIWGMGALAHDTSANGGESATQKHDNSLLEGLIDEKP